MPIIPVILAAGDSRRMGHPKALLPFKGGTFLGHILGTLAEAGHPEPTLVLGRDAARIRNVLPKPARVLINEDPDRGMLSSIQLALSGLDSCEGCLIWPVDQPDISSQLVRELVRLFRESQRQMALPICRGKRGHPAAFRRELFPEILALPAEQGLKSFIQSHAQDIALLPVDELGTIQDVDTPEDYERLTGESLASALAPE
jgi:molybdenum cofactor cytidylyltransferase